MEVVKIGNENDAVMLLESCLVKGDVRQIDKDVKIVFDGWPTFHVRIEGDKFHNSVPTRVMPALLDLQKEINRLYCQVRYNDDSTRRLTQEERAALELVVKVDKGSSLFEVNLGPHIQKISEAVAVNMTPEVLITFAIVSGIGLTSVTMWKQWLNSEALKHNYEHKERLSEQETKRLDLVTRASALHPMVDASVRNGAALKSSLASRIEDNDNLSVNRDGENFEVSGQVAAQVTSKEIVEAVERKISDVFILRSADFSKEGTYRVSLSRTSDGYEFSAIIPEGVLGSDEMSAVERYSWRRQKLSVSLLVIDRNGSYSSAKVLSVSAESAAT